MSLINGTLEVPRSIVKAASSGVPFQPPNVLHEGLLQRLRRYEDETSGFKNRQELSEQLNGYGLRIS